MEIMGQAQQVRDRGETIREGLNSAIEDLIKDEAKLSREILQLIVLSRGC